MHDVQRMRATRTVIHLEHLRHNLRLIRSRVGERDICLAVKADGYGHGAVETAKAALKEGVKAFAVATLDEALELREAGIGGLLLVLSPLLPEEMPEAAAQSLSLVVGDRGMAETYRDCCSERGILGKVHLKIDTGMGRYGCAPEEAAELAGFIASTGSLSLEGTCTHFPSADGGDETFTQAQIDLFTKAVEEIQRGGTDPGILHAANSGGILGHCQSWLTMVRPGIIAYGYYPSRDQERDLALTPVMEFETRVLFIKRVPPGTSISYGRTWKAKRTTFIATLPAGYADGYNRLLSNRGRVAIRGKSYPVAGRVCMDQTMVDLGPETEVRLHDRAVLFGPEPPAPTAEEIAEMLGTIPYEVTCWTAKTRVPRIFSA
jgi:alanine racemase